MRRPLEYYFEPVGTFSIGWFHKTIRDYIVNGIVSGTVESGSDNGYNGEYAGFTILRASNAEVRRPAKCSPFERRRSNATACETGPS